MVYIFDGMKVPGEKVPKPNERVLKILVSPELGNTGKFTTLLSILSPENTISKHTHESDELMYVISGRGIAVVGNERNKIGPDSIIWAPKNVSHEIKNLGDEGIKLLCLFSPPLKPTGRFEKAIVKAEKYFSGK